MVCSAFGRIIRGGQSEAAEADRRAVAERNGSIEAINLMRRVRQDGAGISQPRRPR